MRALMILLLALSFGGCATTDDEYRSPYERSLTVPGEGNSALDRLGAEKKRRVDSGTDGVNPRRR